jgi:hypothetical protein
MVIVLKRQPMQLHRLIEVHLIIKRHVHIDVCHALILLGNLVRWLRLALRMVEVIDFHLELALVLGCGHKGFLIDPIHLV